MDYEQQTDHYLALAEQMLDEAFGERRVEWMQRMEAELPQIRRVLDWLQVQEKGEQGLQLAYLLQEVWFEEVHMVEGLAYLQSFLAMSAESSSLRAMGLDLSGALAMFLGDLATAVSLKNEAIDIQRTLGNQSQLGYALLHQGHLVGDAQGNYQDARAIYEEALAIFKALDDSEGMAHAQSNLANVALALGDAAWARILTLTSLQSYAEAGAEWDQAVTLATAAGVEAVYGRFARAAQLAAASAAHRERIGVSLPDMYQQRFRRLAEKALAGLDKAQQEALWATGQTLSLAEAVNLALEAVNE
jgi:tetratricopeptide (TPR) repeat protein